MSNLNSSGLILSKNNSNKLDYLYEVSIEPETVNPTTLPTINPYTAFGKQQFSPLRKITSLITAKSKGVKEYIQASKVDQYPIPATKKEQFITLQIPNDFPLQWKQQGYTHIHFGAVRLSLSFHGRKGLPVVARVALLDTRFTQYQHACIATVETTLNAGTVFVTLFPNFNMALADPHLLEALKVQVQIIGVEQVSDAIAATLHYQMVYRVQNHALDLAIPGGENALLIRVDEQNTASCTHVPRQISRADLISLLPESWITEYDSLHNQKNMPLESSSSKIANITEGRTSISFDHSHLSRKNSNPLSIMLAEIPMELPTKEGKDLGRYDYNTEKGWTDDIISHFNSKGEKIYHFQDPISGHIYFDVCTKCDDCWWEHTYGTTDPQTSRGKKKKHPQQIEYPDPCKTGPKPQDPDDDNYVSKRSTFNSTNGYQIPISWIYQEPKKDKIPLHPYYQKCLDILEKEAKTQTQKIQRKPPVVQPARCGTPIFSQPVLRLTNVLCSASQIFLL